MAVIWHWEITSADGSGVVLGREAWLKAEGRPWSIGKVVQLTTVKDCFCDLVAERAIPDDESVLREGTIAGLR